MKLSKLGFIWAEIKQLYNEGLIEYLHNWLVFYSDSRVFIYSYINLNYHRWNLLDFITNTLYITTIVLKFISYLIVQNEISIGKETYKLNREKWE